jgi:hypothetical protein
MRGFCHRDPLAREAVTKPKPPQPQPSPREGGCRGPKCRPGAAGTSALCLARGVVWFTQSAHIMNIMVEPATGVQTARVCRWTALIAPTLTRIGPCEPGPDRPGQVCRRVCPSASTSRLGPGRGSDRLVLDEGVLSPGTPRARGGDKTQASAAPTITSGEQMLRLEGLAPGLDGASTLCPPEEQPERAKPFEAHRSADMPCDLPSHQVLIRTPPSLG